MNKERIHCLSQDWYVWLGELPAVQAYSEQAAFKMLELYGREHTEVNVFGRADHACLMAELLIDTPGRVFHQKQYSPVLVIKRDGVARKCLQRLSEGALAVMDDGWVKQQYQIALTDPDVLMLEAEQSMVTA